MTVEYRVAEMGGTRWAVDVVVSGDAGAAADRLIEEMRGGRVDTSSEQLVAALLARGGRLRRRAHDYEHDLASVPAERPLPEGVTLRPLRREDVPAIGAVHDAAYPPGHIDHRPDHDGVAVAGQLVDGTLIGPLIGGASWVAEAGGRVVGAILVNDKPAMGHTPARAWVADVGVLPEWQGRGLGGALLRAALAGAKAAGHAYVGLVVTDGNSAVRAYEAAGFRRVYTGATVDVPE